MRCADHFKRLLVILAAAFVFATPAQSGSVCTLILDARTGQTVQEAGDCDTRVTPASTFKIPLALMGFEDGVLDSASAPVLPFVAGYPDWGGASWHRDTDPARWMRFSVVWYSQQIAQHLGADRLSDYARAFGYGNADFAGDPGQDNGPERSWISSSLLVSPREQAAFIRALLTRSLPVSRDAMDKTLSIIEHHDAGDGWTVWGKTGSAYPRNPDTSFDRARGWGWYVGWAVRADQVLVVVRLDQAAGPGHAHGGTHVRDRLLAGWSEMIEGR